MTRRALTSRLATGLGLLLVASAPAFANEGAIEYRQAVYGAIGGHMSAMAGILKGEVPHQQDIAPHAQAMANLAPMTRHLFPDDSGPDSGRTKAKAAIWDDPDAFAEKRDDFIAAAENLGASAEAPMGEFAEAFQNLGGTCKACHDDFKAD